jgi:hypothetical protein
LTSSAGLGYSGAAGGFVKIAGGSYSVVVGLVMKGLVLVEGGDTAPDIAKGFVLFWAPILKNGFEAGATGSSAFGVSGFSAGLDSKSDFGCSFVA